MKKYLPILQSSSLFRQMDSGEIEDTLKQLTPSVKTFGKNQYIFRSGDYAHALGLVLSGSVHIIKEDFWGNRNMMSRVIPGQIFAETYACLSEIPMTVSVVAAESVSVLFLDIRQIITPAADTAFTAAFVPSGKFMQNFMLVMAEKNLLLNEKITHISKRTTREKLLSYLSAQSLRFGGSKFDIPFNRQQLADYLSVDRSAMSSELGKMRDEGLIQFHKNHFVLKK